MLLTTTGSRLEPEGDGDTRLVAAMATGDAGALQALAARHGPALIRLAYRMLDDAAEAEDVAQEVLLRLWDRAEGWVSYAGGVAGWLRRAATNLCIDRLRRRARIVDAPIDDRVDDRPDAVATLHDEQLGDLARRAMATLSERQRAAIVLTYYEEQSNQVAATILDMNLKAFESLLFRARAALRDKLSAAGVTAADIGGRP